MWCTNKLLNTAFENCNALLLKECDVVTVSGVIWIFVCLFVLTTQSNVLHVIQSSLWLHFWKKWQPQPLMIFQNCLSVAWLSACRTIKAHSENSTRTHARLRAFLPWPNGSTADLREVKGSRNKEPDILLCYSKTQSNQRPHGQSRIITLCFPAIMLHSTARSL